MADVVARTPGQDTADLSGWVSSVEKRETWKPGEESTISWTPVTKMG